MKYLSLSSLASALLLLLLAIAPGSEAGDCTQRLIDFSELALDTESYSYLGQGEFIPLRSGRMPWICLQVDSSTYEPEDSLLHVTGSLFDCMNGADFSKWTFQVFIVVFDSDCVSRSAGKSGLGPHTGDEIVPLRLHGPEADPCVDSYQHVDMVNGREFTLEVTVAQGAVLFIAPAEPDSTASIVLASAAVFEIGKLMRSASSESTSRQSRRAHGGFGSVQKCKIDQYPHLAVEH